MTGLDFIIGDDRTWGNERICHVREHRCMPVLIDHVDGKPVARFHQNIQIYSARMHRYPPGVVSGSWSINAVDQCKLACLAIFLMRPDLVSSQVGRIEVCFRAIEHHSMYSRFGNILVVLDIGFHAATLVDRENVAIARVVVEWISIDIVRWLLGG